ncbi:helix-turn-helix domain-containing protein [Aquimarina algiphila]|uniref:Helix-turn-helix transcriptional regulator n=1 Tax=Aquimarina algiphila TaxID=2047982 RepID=A0A554VBA9_9FLAO|nr:helix-turn-helix transcriptional regulator [Aquimarina algiphila]TSE03796.1 helix-turn-helix transcriptional regulator [Aquimarina algiphila]
MTKIGNKITELRKQKGWSQSELANQIKASREAIGKYERNEALPSVETAKNIADIFDVSLDYLVSDTLKPSFDKRMIERLQDFELLSEVDKSHLFALLDAFLRDAKTKRAYS